MRHRSGLWGIFFVLAGLLILLNYLGIFGGGNVIALVISILLIPVVISSIAHLNFGGIFFPIAIVGILYAGPLGIENLTPWPILGVALLLSIGFTFLFPNHHRYYTKQKESISKHEEDGVREVSEVSAVEDEDVSFETRFGETVKYITSKSLRQTNLSCSFGAMKIYFKDAELSSNGARILVDANFSGIELYIPKEWHVINEIDAILGGVDEKNYSTGLSTNKMVVITGRISFAGVTIIYI